MVRFIIVIKKDLRRVYVKIYIPIWLDLLLAYGGLVGNNLINLHSNMVRFIIRQAYKRRVLVA